MNSIPFRQNPYLWIALIAFLSNIPCGYIRENHPKFSGKWFLWIHASIPLLIYLRLKLFVSPWFIPVTITCAVIGQIIGGRRRRQTITQNERDRLQQIPDMTFPSENSDHHSKLIDERDVAIVLMNMGGPKTNADVKSFLLRLFMDPIILRFPLSRFFQPFFANMIVNARWKEAAKRYQLIGGGSPIYPSTEKQTKALRELLQKRDRPFHVTYSFNYSEPLPEETMKELQAHGKKYILPLSLYPHYSKATTGSNLHYLKEAACRLYPNLTFLPSPSYYLRPGYIRAFVDRIREQLRPGEDLDDFFLLFSTHGLPLYFLKEGDVYPFQISQTIGAILNQLGRNQSWAISYQSAVGPLQWLKPSTDDMLCFLAREGVKKILVVPISFVNDHIETLCEIDMEYRKLAHEKGIEEFRMSRSLETHPGFIEALADAVESVIPAQGPVDGISKSFSEFEVRL